MLSSCSRLRPPVIPQKGPSSSISRAISRRGAVRGDVIVATTARCDFSSLPVVKHRKDGLVHGHGRLPPPVYNGDAEGGGRNGGPRGSISTVSSSPDAYDGSVGTAGKGDYVASICLITSPSSVASVQRAASPRDGYMYRRYIYRQQKDRTSSCIYLLS